jgi:TolA-binding protein
MRSQLKVTAASPLWLLVLFAAGAGLALGCGWGGFENSVRFGYGATDRDRSRLPMLPPDARGAKMSAGSDEPEQVTSKQRAADINALWVNAGEAVSAGELTKARKLLSEFVERTTPDVCGGENWTDQQDCRSRRNSALDRLDALAALDRGSTPERVRSYLGARDAYDSWLASVAPGPDDDVRETSWRKPTPEQLERAARKKEERAAGMRAWDEEVESKLSTLKSDPNLADNAAYLRAAGMYRVGREGDPLEAFESVASRYPAGEKREAALYMAGRVALESSVSYAGGGETATSEDPCLDEGCRDEFWTRARRDFARLIADYPRGRYSSDARGWLAYSDLRVGDEAGALVEYYRLLSDASDAPGRELAVRSLRLVRGRADDEDMDAVERELEDEPRAALAYAYHNVYSYSQAYYLDVPGVTDADPYGSGYSSDDSRRQEHQEATLRERAERKELKRAADFASRMLRRQAGANFGGAFLVRLAEAQFELGEDKTALEVARRALSSSLEADERVQALWVEGVAEHRLKDYASARRTLGRLVEEFPRGDLARDARVMLATVAEDSGDLASALEQYLALGYDPDVAYFVDVLMTPEQLSSFVASHESSPRRDELLYSLGLRYMRAGRYAEARAALSRVRTTADDYYLTSRRAGYSYYAGDEDESPSHPKLNFRHTFWDEDGEGEEYATRTDAREDPLAGRDTRVYSDWLLRDMQTLEDLERLQREVESARTVDAKAEAMYQLASYFYEGELLFYNPAMWRGMRAEMIGSLSETTYRSPAEAQAVRRYEQEHEGPARAVPIYLEVVRLYPKTRAARDSLYTAILCHQRLSEFNGYWRGMYSEGLHAGPRVVTYADLRSAYPDYRLPSGTSGWQPSTRTVYGRPAWPAPPKPKQPTGVERARSKIAHAERRVSQAWGLFGELYGGRVRGWTVRALRWALAALVAAFVLVVFRLSRRSRRFLYRRLARRIRRGRASRVSANYAPKSSYAAHVSHGWGATLCADAADAARGLLRLALHERARAALALNVLTHGLLTLLVWSLLRAAQ